MNIVKISCVALLMSLSQIVVADASSEAERLLDIMNMEIVLQESIDVSLDAQVQANPTIAPFKGVMKAFFEKYMSYESMKPDLVEMYVNTFTESELKEINAFYLTPTGQKTVLTMPDLMNQGAELGMRKVQENMAELERMITAEAKRLEELAKDSEK